MSSAVDAIATGSASEILEARAAREPIRMRTDTLFAEQRDLNYRRIDRMFAGLMLGQWIFAITIAVLYSPYGWAGKVHTVHLHVQAAVLLGGLLSSLPIALAFVRPGSTTTRYVIAVAQMLWSALLIHLTGGRIETHFHVFGSLAFLAFYRDWKVLIPATVVVATDHLVRGIVWPESVYGTVNPEWWRFLEHAFWVVFEDMILIAACLRGVDEMRTVAIRQAELEEISKSERDKSLALDRALAEVKESQAAVLRAEKLAAVGQLAASVGHELRNPLTAVRNATTYISKRFAEPDAAQKFTKDPRVPQFLDIVDRELQSCGRIIGDLLDFARDKPPTRAPCPLRPLAAEAIALVPSRPNVTVVNQVPDDIPIPVLDREQFRQVLINLVQNAIESIDAERSGEVRVSAEGGDDVPWVIRVTDNGVGMSDDVASKVFQPLFTTKTKGTGLGLAIVANMINRHQASIRVESEVGRGSQFLIEIPATPTTAQEMA